MENFLPIKNNINLLRDPNTNSIVNSNTSDYNNYMILKNNKNMEKNKISNLEGEIKNIKNDIEEVKYLLKTLLKENT